MNTSSDPIFYKLNVNLISAAATEAIGGSVNVAVTQRYLCYTSDVSSSGGGTSEMECE